MRIEVDIEIKTKYVLTDNGYTSNMTLPEIEKWMKDKVRSLQVLIKQGGAELKIVPADFTIKKIIFQPDKGEV